MKKILFLVVAMTVIISSQAFSAAFDDFLKINEGYKNLQNSSADNVSEKKLNLEESEVFYKLLKSKIELDKLVAKADKLETGLLKRLRDRLQFEVTYENRIDLNPYLEKINEVWNSNKPVVKSKRKISYIYGNEVDLLNGSWQGTKDGHKFWVSNEYNDIVLSPAEYRKYSREATIVDE